MTPIYADFDTLFNGSGTLGVAVSGGGDSVALLEALAEWGQRPLHVFCVDHRINPNSAQWTQTVAGHAQRLNLPFTALAWDGAKPQTGLSAAARAARHGLLADAARSEGIRVLCLAHTADDVAEAQAMRDQGSTVGTPRRWSPSPAWPQGRGMTLCRPLLGASRAQLRDYLRQRDIAWIDDPANDSETSLRARTRKVLKGAAPLPETEGAGLTRAELDALMHDPEGWADLGLLRFRADALHALPREAGLKLLAAAAVCAGGGDRLPRRDSVDAILTRLPDGAVHTLCGARLRQTDGLIHVVREAGDIVRNPRPLLDRVWDGRFELNTNDPVAASGVVRGHLDEADRAWLLTLPAPLRTVLPVVMTVRGPYLARPAHRTLTPGLYDTVTGWVSRRVVSAVCRVDTETDL